jgi:ribosomal protein S18 acetylase RimI-like enzyme
MDVEIRPLSANDADALHAFFERVPEGDRTYFREDVSRPGLVNEWLGDEKARRYVAVDGDEIVGYVAVIPEVGLSSHVSQLRLVVDPARRRQGVGRDLARHAFIRALEAGATKIVVEVAAEQDAALRMFGKLGFEAEALLKDHLRGRDGSLHDMFVLSHFVADTWANLASTGVDTLVGP